ncbi:MAG: S41 family peptidase [Candidatus Aminicenantes bacterium]|nr:S41 family peptidase [Candidatus Aminicenantes bacterium]
MNKKHSYSWKGRCLIQILGALMIIFVLVSFSWGGFSSAVQEEPESKEFRLEKSTKSAVIDWVSEKLNEIYVFPEVAKKIEEKMREKFKNGEYDDITDPRRFARVLSGDMMRIAHDRHMGLRFSLEPSFRVERLDPEEEKKRLEQKVKSWRYDNFGFKKAERLAGNVAYLRFDEFADSVHGGDTAVAALNFFSFCDALIIDLRYNGGGYGDMVKLLSSYFFDEETLLLERYNRNENKTSQSWTSSYIPGKRLNEVDLYILTRRRTFSAAEAFAFALKNLKRATIVGEKTGGGAHTVESFRNEELKMELRVPNARAMDPKTGKNWEGIGVQPDVECPPEKALDTAYLLALEKIHARTGPGGNLKEWLAWLIDYNKVKSAPVDVGDAVLQSYAGTYGPVRIVFEEGRLWVLQPGRKDKELLLAKTEDTFIIDGDPNIRIRFEKNEQGEVIAALGLFFDGSSDRYAKRK